jgi:hypothetical protein
MLDSDAAAALVVTQVFSQKCEFSTVEAKENELVLA